jgi:uncharacterized membrane protein YeaQ/YmgE (transglycosylase-associated protein family)
MIRVQKSTAKRAILFILALCTYATNAHGWSLSSRLHLSTRQTENAITVLVWVVLGLTAGFLGSQLVLKRGNSVLPDLLAGLIGAVAGGWIFFSYGPPGVNGLHLYSHLAAAVGSLAILLAYYAFKRPLV